jgi:hypothetical protein
MIRAIWISTLPIGVFPTARPYHILDFPYIFPHIMCWDFSLCIFTYYLLGFFPMYFHILFVGIFPYVYSHIICWDFSLCIFTYSLLGFFLFPCTSLSMYMHAHIYIFLFSFSSLVLSVYVSLVLSFSCSS